MAIWSKIKKVASSVGSAVAKYSNTIKGACSGAVSGFAVGGVVGAVVGAGVGGIAGYKKDKETIENEKNDNNSSVVVSASSVAGSLSAFDILTTNLRGSLVGLAK